MVNQQRQSPNIVQYRGREDISTRHIEICDAIWENPPHVAEGNFAEINQLILKLLCFSLFFISFDNT